MADNKSDNSVSNGGSAISSLGGNIANTFIQGVGSTAADSLGGLLNTVTGGIAGGAATRDIGGQLVGKIGEGLFGIKGLGATSNPMMSGGKTLTEHDKEFIGVLSQMIGKEVAKNSGGGGGGIMGAIMQVAVKGIGSMLFGGGGSGGSGSGPFDDIFKGINEQVDKIMVSLEQKANQITNDVATTLTSPDTQSKILVMLMGEGAKATGNGLINDLVNGLVKGPTGDGSNSVTSSVTTFIKNALIGSGGQNGESGGLINEIVTFAKQSIIDAFNDDKIISGFSDFITKALSSIVPDWVKKGTSLATDGAKLASDITSMNPNKIAEHASSMWNTAKDWWNGSDKKDNKANVKPVDTTPPIQPSVQQVPEQAGPPTPAPVVPTAQQSANTATPPQINKDVKELPPYKVNINETSSPAPSASLTPMSEVNKPENTNAGVQQADNVSESEMKEILKNSIKHSEGLYLQPYLDPPGNTNNQYSVGYGHLIKKGEEELMNGVTKEQAEQIFDKDFNEHTTATAKNFHGFDKLDSARKAVVLDMGFNMGPSWETVLTDAAKAIQEQRWQDAYKEILNTKYAKQVGPRAQRNANVIVSGSMDEFKKGTEGVITPINNAAPKKSLSETASGAVQSVKQYTQEEMTNIGKDISETWNKITGGGWDTSKRQITATPEQSIGGGFDDSDYDYNNSAKVTSMPIDNQSFDTGYQDSGDSGIQQPKKGFGFSFNFGFGKKRKKQGDDNVAYANPVDGSNYQQPTQYDENQLNEDLEARAKARALRDEELQFNKEGIIDSENIDEKYKAGLASMDLGKQLEMSKDKTDKDTQEANKSLIQNISSNFNSSVSSMGQNISKALQGLKDDGSGDELDELLSDNPKLTNLLLGYD